mmetsp:Transcript_26890/g.64536  ORF Transcript_26890/g.64536 Transcript_26890/m.64536 type:complete len:206 (+) Transcript_26890:1892-2509(+)
MAREVMEVALLLVSAVQSGAIVEQPLNIVKTILLLLHRVLYRGSQRHLPIQWMQVNVLMAMKVMASALKNLYVVQTGAIVVLASNIVFRPGLILNLANQVMVPMMVPVAAEVPEMAIVGMTFVAPSLDSVARASSFVRVLMSCKSLMNPLVQLNKSSRTPLCPKTSYLSLAFAVALQKSMQGAIASLNAHTSSSALLVRSAGVSN